MSRFPFAKLTQVNDLARLRTEIERNFAAAEEAFDVLSANVVILDSRVDTAETDISTLETDLATEIITNALRANALGGDLGALSDFTPSTTGSFIDWSSSSEYAAFADPGVNVDIFGIVNGFVENVAAVNSHRCRIRAGYSINGGSSYTNGDDTSTEVAIAAAVPTFATFSAVVQASNVNPTGQIRLRAQVQVDSPGSEVTFRSGRALLIVTPAV